MFPDQSKIKLNNSDIKITRKNPKCLEIKKYTSKQPMNNRKKIAKEKK